VPSLSSGTIARNSLTPKESFARPPGWRPYGPEGQDSARVRQRTDQPLAEQSLQRIISRRSTQMDTVKEILESHRRDAEYAEVRIFAQSGDDDWAKDLVFRRGMFLFVVVSRQTKKAILCALCVSAVKYPNPHLR